MATRARRTGRSTFTPPSQGQQAAGNGSIQTDLLKEARKLQRELNIESEAFKEIQAQILQGLIKNKRVLHDIVDQTYADQEANQANNILIEDRAKLLSDLLKPVAKGLNMTEKSFKLEMEMLDAAYRKGDLDLKSYVSSRELLKVLKQQFVITSDMSETEQAKILAARKSYEGQLAAITELQSGLDNFFGNLPGGKLLSEALGLDDISTKLQKAVLKGLDIKSLGKGLTIVTALAAVLKIITDEANKFAESTGVTFGQAQKIGIEARSTANSLDMQLATNEDIMKVQEKTITTFGTVAMMTTKQAGSIAELGKAYSYGADTAAEFNNVMMTMGATVSEAYDVQNETAALALKSGVSVGAVTKDIAQNGKAAMKYFGGNSKALGTAAVEAAKMGMSLQGIVKTSDALLNIQDSLTKQFEFQALTGRQIDLDKARQLSFDGKIAEAANETLDALEKSGDISKLRPNELRKAAELAGMEVDELQKSLIVRKKLAGMDKDTIAAATTLNLSKEQLEKMDEDQLLAAAKQQQSMNTTLASFDTMKGELINALVPAAELLVNAFNLLIPILKLISFIAIPISDAITGMVGGVQNLVGLFTGTNVELTNMQKILGVIAGIYVAIKGYALATQIIEATKLAMKMEQGSLDARQALLEKRGLVRNIGIAVMKAYANLGPILGLAAAGGIVALGYKYLNTGDLAMGANNGPIVTNPREGTIFQGTKNDEVAMGPGVIGMAQSSGNSQTIVAGGSNTDMTETNNLLRQLLNKNSVAVVNWNDGDTRNIQGKLTSDRSLRQSNLGGTA